MAYYVFDDAKNLFEGMTKEQIVNAIAAATGLTPEQIDADVITSAIKEQNAQRSIALWVGTQAEFNAIDTPDENTLYVVTDPNETNEMQSEIDNMRAEIHGLGVNVDNIRPKDSHKNDLISVAEFTGVARSYYLARGIKANPTFSYGADNTALDNDFNGKNIDCSTFIGMLLRGIPYEKSAYYNPNVYPQPESEESEDEGDGDSGSNDGTGEGFYARNTAANTDEFGWAINPSIYRTPKNDGDSPTPVRRAAQLGELLKTQGMALELLPDFSNVEPGDVIFWAKTVIDENGNKVPRQPDRYMNISHVAICYSVLPAPDDVTISKRANAEIIRIDTFSALTFLEMIFAAENNVYKVEKRGNEWTIAKQLANNTYDTPITLTASNVDAQGNQLATGVERLVEIAVCVKQTDSSVGSMFQITQYYWDRQKYPIKHTMMEVTNIAPYVLNRTLEKNRPDEVVLICRPDLGAVRPDAFAGNISNVLNVTSVSDIHRAGRYYLTSAVTGGLPNGYDNGNGLILDVATTMTKHGKIYTTEQTITNARSANSPIHKRAKYCYSASNPALRPDEVPWNAWTAYVPIPAGGSAGQVLAKASGEDYDLTWITP